MKKKKLNRTIGPGTYVKKNKHDELKESHASGPSMRRINRHPKLVAERAALAQMGLAPEYGKKKVRKGNNRKNTLGGRKRSKFTPKKRR